VVRHRVRLGSSHFGSSHFGSSHLAVSFGAGAPVVWFAMIKPTLVGTTADTAKDDCDGSAEECHDLIEVADGAPGCARGVLMRILSVLGVFLVALVITVGDVWKFDELLQKPANDRFEHRPHERPVNPGQHVVFLIFFRSGCSRLQHFLPVVAVAGAMLLHGG